MSHRKPHEIPSDEASPYDAWPDSWGDLICPTCNAMIVTPMDYAVIPGIGTCTHCQKKFHVTRRAALICNERAALAAPRLASKGLL